MHTLTQTDDLSLLIRSRPLMILQFGSSSCAPCTAIRARLDRWAESRPRAGCVYIPIEDFPADAAAHSVFTVPTLLVFAGGRLTLRESGYFSLDLLLDRADRYLDLLS